ncbi:unnamed protein product [Victoria cruziana]
MVANNLPAPADVVAMYNDKGIAAMRLFDPNLAALIALKGSQIQVALGVKNEDLASIAGSQAAADQPYITVVNEAVPGPNAQYILPAMQNLLNSTTAGLSSKIRVTMVVARSVLGPSYPPSTGAFSDDVMGVMSPIVSNLSSNGSPFLANVHPYFACTVNPGQIALPYALFNSEGPIVQDGNLSYQNLFDAMVDTLYSALEKTGGSSVEIVVSESGWPSTCVHNFIAHATSANGTPKRPGKPIEAFVFAMFNEDLKPGNATERNFGLFFPNKEPVYPIFK